MPEADEFDENLLRQGGMNEMETFYGLIESTADALRIVELCRQGKLGRVSRRLQDKERSRIRSGSVFVFDEIESGVKRWTDGRIWSPSRILGNFLIYRELERRTSDDAYEDVEERDEWSSDSLLAGASDALTAGEDSELAGLLPWLSEPVLQENSQEYNGDIELEVLQSKKLLTNHKGRFIFKPGGLIKKTISIRIDNHPHHLICYYNKKDFCSGHIHKGTPLGSDFNHELMSKIREIPIPQELLAQQHFRKPVNVNRTVGEDDTIKGHAYHEDLPVVRKPTPKRRSSFPGATLSVRPKTEIYYPYYVPIAPAIESTSSLGDSLLGHHQIPLLTLEHTANANPLQLLSEAYPIATPPRTSSKVELPSDIYEQPVCANLERLGYDPVDIRNAMKWSAWFTNPDNLQAQLLNDENGYPSSPTLQTDPMMASLRPPSTVFEVSKSPEFDY